MVPAIIVHKRDAVLAVLLDEVIEKEALACNDRDARIDLYGIDVKLGAVGNEPLGEGVAAAANDQRARGVRQVVADLGHGAVVDARQLKVQVIGQIADALEGAVHVEQAHGRAVVVCRFKDERGTKLCAAHLDAAALKQPRKRKDNRKENPGDNNYDYEPGWHVRS